MGRGGQQTSGTEGGVTASLRTSEQAVPQMYRGVKVRAVGEQAFFEYHCHQGHDSSDAAAWYRTQQPVTILECHAPDLEEDEEAGYGYVVQFLDGHTHQTFDDELHDSPEQFGTQASVGEGGFYAPSSEEIRPHDPAYADWAEANGYNQPR